MFGIPFGLGHIRLYLDLLLLERFNDLAGGAAGNDKCKQKPEDREYEICCLYYGITMSIQNKPPVFTYSEYSAA